MYEDRDRENMDRSEREEQRVNWTTPERLEQGRQERTDQEQAPYRQQETVWREPSPYPSEKRKKNSGKGRMFRRAAGITVAAVLFGTVSGGVMAGINYVGNRLAAGISRTCFADRKPGPCFRT